MVEPTMLPPRVLLILPCYNEAPSVGLVLREIQALGAWYDTVVIDDGSTDLTSQVASSLSPCVRLIENLGIGGAVQTGIKYAQMHGYDFCVQVDGDGQHPPKEVPVLLDTYRKAAVNIVIGSRYVASGSFRSTWARRLGSKVIGISLKWLFGKPVSDPTSGFRLMDRAAIAFFAREYPHDFPEPISIAKALASGLTIAEARVSMRSRQYGDSSITPNRTVLYMVRVLGYIVLLKIQQKLGLLRRG